mmetsp:Transcript_28241/g.51354  ORF Transcript_28241/g.51354 Transcript_28241/m.51354 type:complete len:224 (+) Transcript_28241:227-898(+)
MHGVPSKSATSPLFSASCSSSGERSAAAGCVKNSSQRLLPGTRPLYSNPLLDQSINNACPRSAHFSMSPSPEVNIPPSPEGCTAFHRITLACFAKGLSTRNGLPSSLPNLKLQPIGSPNFSSLSMKDCINGPKVEFASMHSCSASDSVRRFTYPPGSQELGWHKRQACQKTSASLWRFSSRNPVSASWKESSMSCAGGTSPSSTSSSFLATKPTSGKPPLAEA